MLFALLYIPLGYSITQLEMSGYEDLTGVNSPFFLATHSLKRH